MDPVCDGYSGKGLVQQHHWQFEMFREAHKVQDFQLVLCADVCDCMIIYSVRELENAPVAAEKASGGFDTVFSLSH